MTTDASPFYDRLWAERPLDLNDDERARLAEIGRLVAPLSPVEGGILEIGCGTGWLTAWLSRCGQVRGVDPSAEAIAQARRRYPGVAFDRIGEEEDVGSSVAALVVSSEVIEHVADPRVFMRRLAAAVVPGGHVVMTTPNLAARRHWMAMGPVLQPRENWLARRELEALARLAGLEVLASRSFFTRFTSKGWYRLVNSPRLNRLIAPSAGGAPLERVAERLDLGLYLSLLARRPA